MVLISKVLAFAKSFIFKKIMPHMDTCQRYIESSVFLTRVNMLSFQTPQAFRAPHIAVALDHIGQDKRIVAFCVSVVWLMHFYANKSMTY